MQNLKLGVIGYGRIGRRHCEVVENKINNLELIAVSEIHTMRNKEAKTGQNLNVYMNYKEMIKKENLDIVTICTESGNHARDVIECAGEVENIIVEKPMALTIEDAKKMIKICKERKSRLFVVKQNRFNLPIVKVRELFDKGYFGKIFLATVRVRWYRNSSYYQLDDWRGTWSLDGGVIANQASHHVDILEWFLGKPVSVFATGTSSINGKETEDTCVATIKFESGALGLVEATTATRPKDLEGSFSIMGDGGTAIVGGFALNKMEILEFVDSKIDFDLKDFSSNPPDVYGFGHKKYYENVVHSILNNESALVEGEEGLKSLELISAIYSSMENNQEVFLQNFIPHSKLGKNAI